MSDSGSCALTLSTIAVMRAPSPPPKRCQKASVLSPPANGLPFTATPRSAATPRAPPPAISERRVSPCSIAVFATPSLWLANINFASRSASPGTRWAMDSERRRARIVDLVRSHDFVRVADLGEMFGVSPVTVRGDLDVLAARGEIRRIRGGAISHDASAPDGEPGDLLGRAAAALLHDGECAFVSASAVAVGAALAGRNAVIVTNGLEVARALESGRPTVVVTGGTLGRAGALVDPLGELVVGRINADLAFVACEAIE